MPSNIQYVFGAPDPMCVCLCFFLFYHFAFVKTICVLFNRKNEWEIHLYPQIVYTHQTHFHCVLFQIMDYLTKIIDFHLSSILTTCCCWFFLLFFSPNSSCDETSNYLMHMLWKFSNKNPAIYCYCCVLWSSHVVMLIHKFSNLCVNSVSFILSLPSISLTE